MVDLSDFEPADPSDFAPALRLSSPSKVTIHDNWFLADSIRSS